MIKNLAEMIAFEEEVVLLRKQYNELLFAVESKHPEETRHETALRYIQQAEQGDSLQGAESGEAGTSAEET